MDDSQEPNLGPDQILSASSMKGWEPSSAVQLQMTSSGPESVAPVSVYTLLYQTADQYPLQQALAVKREGQWIYWSYQDYFKECCIVAKAFIKLGLDRFHGVCIMGFNSPEWLIANFGCIFAGGISTGVYTTNSTDACRHLAHDCRAQIAVLENAIYVEKFMAVKHLLPHLKVIVQWSGTVKADGVISWEQLMDIGKQETDDALQARLKLQAVNQCCTLIYTSGTTGPPKGVMCSQDSLTWAGSQYAIWFKLKPCCESIVSYLPFSHLAAQMTELYLSIPAASTIYFAQPDALKGSLGKTLVEVQPTCFLAIPRVWEKMHEKMREVAGKSSYATRMVADWAKHQGLAYYRAMMEGREQTWSERLQYRLARVLVLDRVKTALGLGNATRLVSGTAPISVEVMEYFFSLDMPIMECYGLSESLSIGSANEIYPGGFKFNSVGKVMRLTSLKLRKSPMASDQHEGEGEICMKGRNVFMGYLNLPDKTNETILDDGWMVSGDLGWIDTDGFLHISGRVKELVITAGGENIPPVLIEDVIKKELPILSNAMLIGDKRKFLTILLTVKCDVDPDSGAPLDTLTPPVVAWCADQGLAVTTVTELKREIDHNRRGAVAKAVQAAIDRYNNHHAISNAQKVQRWTLLSHDFSQYTGELNNTLKLKRSVVAEMYADTIDRLYGDSYQ